MEQKEEIGKKNKVLPLIVISVAVLAFTIGIGLLLNNNNKNSTNSENKDNGNGREQNDVVLDGFTYAPLKLEANEENLVYSPLSIKYALSMLNEGAEGETKEEIDKLIKDLNLTKYNDIDKVLSLANAVYIRDTYKDIINENYTNSLKEKYNAEVIYDEFTNADNVNKWIEEKTFGLIKKMLKDEIVQDPDTKLLLVNALAIDMAWETSFSQEYTGSKPFTRADGKEINTAMMHKTSEEYDYYQDEFYSALSMPFREYENTELEFIAIMPNQDNLKDILTKDDMNNTITGILDKMHAPGNNVELSISIPRFDFEYETNLSKDLYTMGIKKAFTSQAEFGLIGPDIYVSDVLHKANIKCSEKGVKAAAATVIVLKDNAMIYEPDPKEIVYLNFNKPFMFIIRDTNTKEVWFVGTVYNPVLWENVQSDYKFQ